MNDSTHERKIIMYPSLRVMTEFFLTKMKGKAPAVKVMMKLIKRAARALSFPFFTETSTDKNMNNALTRSAKPTFLDMTLRFIC